MVTDDVSQRSRDSSSGIRSKELRNLQIDLDEKTSLTVALDELQALNTALCFLCTVNADVNCVENFLKDYPSCLLLEGTGFPSEDSAQKILEDSLRRCKCNVVNRTENNSGNTKSTANNVTFPSKTSSQRIQPQQCCRNRIHILKLVNLGFEHYYRFQVFERLDDKDEWYPNDYSIQPTISTILPQSYGQKPLELCIHQLSKAEEDIRHLRDEEHLLNNEELRSALEIRVLQDEIALMRARMKSFHKSALIMLVSSCTRSQKHHRNNRNRSPSPFRSPTSPDVTETTKIYSDNTITTNDNTGNNECNDKDQDEGSFSNNHRLMASKLSNLENRLAIATVALESIEREKEKISLLIRDERRKQFDILKYTFRGCQRHVYVEYTERQPTDNIQSRTTSNSSGGGETKKKSLSSQKDMANGLPQPRNPSQQTSQSSFPLSYKDKQSRDDVSL